jgi:hypothetical protein
MRFCAKYQIYSKKVQVFFNFIQLYLQSIKSCNPFLFHSYLSINKFPFREKLMLIRKLIEFNDINSFSIIDIYLNKIESYKKISCAILCNLSIAREHIFLLNYYFVG